MRTDLKTSWWYWPGCAQHPCHGQLHPRHQRYIQRSGTHVACVQQHCTLRRSGSHQRRCVPILSLPRNSRVVTPNSQGGGKRKGAFAVYLEPWHADIMAFLDLKKNHGVEEERARDLFYGLWMSDLFMKRVEANQQWSLFCPNEAPGLSDCYGAKFEALYGSSLSCSHR